MRTMDSSKNRAGTGRRNASRRGAILGVVMIILLAIGLMGSGLIQMGTSDAVETSRLGQHSQAFWLAEAGLHESMHQLATDDWYRDGISRDSANPSTYGPVTVNGGEFEAEIWRGPFGTAESNTFYILSAGTVVGQTRQVMETATIEPEGYDMPFYSNAITARALWLRNSTEVSGAPVSCFTTNATPQRIIENFTFREPPTTPPMLDTSAYDAVIHQADASGVPASTLTNLNNLGNSTIYVDGDITISPTNRFLQGPGTLVASGSITLGQGVTNDANIRLIAGGELLFRQGCTVGTNCTLYAGENIVIDQGGVVINQCSMLTPGDIIGRQSFEFSGVMYAGGNVTINQGATIRGVMVSGGMALESTATLNNSVTVIYDPGVFPPNPPFGLGGVYVVWQEWHEVLN